MKLRETYGTSILWTTLKEEYKEMSNQELAEKLEDQGYEKKRIQKGGKKVTVWEIKEETRSEPKIDWKKFKLNNSRQRMIDRGIIDEEENILDELRFEFLKMPWSGFTINPGSCGLSYAGYPLNRCAVAWYVREKDPKFLNEFIKLYQSGENPTPANTKGDWIKIDKEEDFDKIHMLRWEQDPLSYTWKQEIEKLIETTS